MLVRRPAIITGPRQRVLRIVRRITGDLFEGVEKELEAGVDAFVVLLPEGRGVVGREIRWYRVGNVVAEA